MTQVPHCLVSYLPTLEVLRANDQNSDMQYSSVKKCATSSDTVVLQAEAVVSFRHLLDSFILCEALGPFTLPRTFEVLYNSI